MDKLAGLTGALDKGLPIPSMVKILPATYDEASGSMRISGALIFPAAEVEIKVTSIPPNKDIARGAVALVNELARQVGPQDETPGVLTLRDLGETTVNVLLGKR